MPATRRFLLPLIALIAACAVSTQALALPRASLAEINPLSGIFDNTGQAFSGWNLALDLASIALTPVFVKSGADIKYHNYFFRHPALDDISCPGFFSGFYLPYVLGGGLLVWGLAGDAPRELAAGSAVLQAGLIGFACQAVMKAFTGRVPPEATYYNGKDASRSFHLGFLENGILDGWPSGHMMTITASLFSLWPLYPDSAVVKISTGVFLLYLLVSVSAHDGATEHWLSELVVGTVLGYTIGTSVGEGFARLLGGRPATGGGISLAPTVGQVNGLALHVGF